MKQEEAVVAAAVTVLIVIHIKFSKNEKDTGNSFAHNNFIRVQA